MNKKNALPCVGLVTGPLEAAVVPADSVPSLFEWPGPTTVKKVNTGI